jgi:hypothetical protein
VDKNFTKPSYLYIVEKINGGGMNFHQCDKGDISSMQSYSCAGSEVCVGDHLQEHDGSFLFPLHSAGSAVQWWVGSHQLCKLSDVILCFSMHSLDPV